MKRFSIVVSLFLLAATAVYAGGYKVGDKATDFKLENIDGKYVSMSDYPDAKGFVVVFTCNGCPYAKAYQDRLIAIDKEYKRKGYPVIAINPNNTKVKPEDNLKGMKKRAKDKGYTFPYLKDAKYEVFKEYGATRTPHVYVLSRMDKDLVVSYVGAIDDNYQDASAVKDPYLADALDALLAGKKPEPDFTKAIGCTTKQ
jgi:peroxiredoxin